jgi:hypothetical protein
LVRGSRRVAITVSTGRPFQMTFRRSYRSLTIDGLTSRPAFSVRFGVLVWDFFESNKNQYILPCNALNIFVWHHFKRNSGDFDPNLVSAPTTAWKEWFLGHFSSSWNQTATGKHPTFIMTNFTSNCVDSRKKVAQNRAKIGTCGTIFSVQPLKTDGGNAQWCLK